MTWYNLFPLQKAKQSSVFEVQCLSLVSSIELKLINSNSVSARLVRGGAVQEEREDYLCHKIVSTVRKIQYAEIWSNQFLTIKVQPLNEPVSSFPSLEAEQ